MKSKNTLINYFINELKRDCEFNETELETRHLNLDNLKDNLLNKKDISKEINEKVLKIMNSEKK